MQADAIRSWWNEADDAMRRRAQQAMDGVVSDELIASLVAAGVLIAGTRWEGSADPNYTFHLPSELRAFLKDRCICDGQVHQGLVAEGLGAGQPIRLHGQCGRCGRRYRQPKGWHGWYEEA